MSGINIFEDDWRNCLRAHYAHVIREHDTNNETSLITVLIQTGFTEGDILSMRQEIVMELGWVDPAPQIEAPVVEAEPEVQASPVEAAAEIETGPLVTFAAPESVPALDAPPQAPATLLEEELADAELSAEEEAMLTVPEAEAVAAAPEPPIAPQELPQIVPQELPLDASALPADPVTPPETPNDTAPHAPAPLPERKPEKKKPKKTQQMSLF